MHEWIMQNWMVMFGVVAGLWCVKWALCFLFKGSNGRWKWEK